jgi:uncharacterized protein YydD (DUF2326 family)
MRLSRLYTNQPALFTAVNFNPGLNVVMAEIRLPKNRAKDTHNLGKTTLGRLIDFCFLGSKDSKFFLFKHFDLFKQFVFFLEVGLADGSFLTIRRGVDEATKISFKKHEAHRQDFSNLVPAEWDHADLPFERAKEMLDGLLDWRGVSPWHFRKGLGYQLRSQDDYGDVFHLGKFSGAHSDWKPYLAHILGFDASIVAQHYKMEAALEEKKEAARTVNAELGGTIEDISKVEGMLLLKQQETERKQRLLNAFDFRSPDQDRTKQLVDEVDAEIASLNSERYTLSAALRKINASLEEDQILFSVSDARKLFQEAGVLFPGSLQKDFQQLIAFNKAITEERRQYLVEEKLEIETGIERLSSELNKLGKKRSDALEFLSETDIFAKYRTVSDELVTLKADTTSLERQRGFIQRLQALRSEIRSLTDECNSLQAKVEADVEKQNTDHSSRFSRIRIYFSEFVELVMSHKALLSVTVNEKGHLEFKAEILDSAGNETSADLGHTYRKLLCIAFDLAVLRAHLDQRFPRFVFHDGALESLDKRKKLNLISAIREYTGLGIQSVITLIDSDLPARKSNQKLLFDSSEMVLTLHDEGEDGRLFKMRTW